MATLGDRKWDRKGTRDVSKYGYALALFWKMIFFSDRHDGPGFSDVANSPG